MFSGFSGAKLRFFWRTTKLLQDFLLKIVEMGLAGGAVAEESDTDALPIAPAHRERITGRREVFTIGAVGELMAVADAVVGDTQIELWETAFLYDLPLTTSFDKDTLRT